MRLNGAERRGAVAGLLAAAAGLGVGQFVAGLTGASGSPVVVVGELQIDFTPPWLKNFAISEFGSHDKQVLVGGILVVLAIFAAVLGAAATRRLAYGMTGLAVFGAIGVTAAATRPTATVASLLPTLAATAVAAVVLRILISLASAEREADEPGGAPRRAFLAAGAAAAGVAAAAGLSGRLLTERSSVASARQAVRLPRPSGTPPALPAATDLRIPGLASFITPNSAFYRVDTALVLPQVDPSAWRLRIHGMVGREITLSFHDLMRRPLIEDYITLCCVSNPVGGPYIGNALWLGVSLGDLLRQAGIRAGADQLMCTSADGFTSGTPVQPVMDGRDALIAVAMNGQPLPVAHGFPARMVVPGLYGYVSATKWVVDLFVTRFDRDVAYWTPRGWSEKAPIKTESRIDVPRNGAQVRAGTVAVAGVAWAQHRGIERVEVRVDAGGWQQARLAAEASIDTWRQWVYAWDAAPGSHTLQVRATDRTGTPQTGVETPPAPNGATGWHTIRVDVA
jgi:DMSO/TMAO reductase YedYZ molybdopterin-dependent catalytic subunit